MSVASWRQTGHRASLSSQRMEHGKLHITWPQKSFHCTGLKGTSVQIGQIKPAFSKMVTVAASKIEGGSASMEKKETMDNNCRSNGAKKNIHNGIFKFDSWNT